MRPSEYLCALGPQRTLIFDLDNTLYDEHEFLFGGYERVARYVSAEAGIDAAECSQFLRDTYSREGRRNLFGKLLRQFSLGTVVSLDDIVSRFRDLRGVRLRCFSYVDEAFRRVSRVFIVTDGASVQQRAKCEALALSSLAEDVVVACTAEHVAKPSTATFEWLRAHYAMREPIYFGDSDVDAAFANNCGIAFARVKCIRDPNGLVVESTLSIETELPPLDVTLAS